MPLRPFASLLGLTGKGFFLPASLLPATVPVKPTTIIILCEEDTETYIKYYISAAARPALCLSPCEYAHIPTHM